LGFVVDGDGTWPDGCGVGVDAEPVVLGLLFCISLAGGWVPPCVVWAAAALTRAMVAIRAMAVDFISFSCLRKSPKENDILIVEVPSLAGGTKDSRGN
jgi:hypothetical protein